MDFIYGDKITTTYGVTVEHNKCTMNNLENQLHRFQSERCVGMRRRNELVDNAATTSELVQMHL